LFDNSFLLPFWSNHVSFFSLLLVSVVESVFFSLINLFSNLLFLFDFLAY
jgi:hypothetical protein